MSGKAATMRDSMRRAALALGLAGLAGCGDGAMHAGQLQLHFAQQDNLLPDRAQLADGRPFSGMAYDTFFGEAGPRDCTEWQGRFDQGKPVGEFRVYSNCRKLDSSWRYRDGHWVRAATGQP